MWKYLPTLATAALAVLQLVKDWAAHESTWRRAVVLVLIMLLGVGGAINTYYSDRQHDKELSAAQDSSAVLKSQLSVLQKSVSTLQTQNTDLITRNQDLQNDLDGIRGKLKVPAKRVRNIPEGTKVSDSLTATPKHH